MKIIKIKHITRKFIQEHPEYIFLFGDNFEGKGYGGQAKEMRGEKNALGIVTKRFPSNHPQAFLDDHYFEQMKSLYDTVFANIPKTTTVVIPEKGIGTGLAQLDKKAPKIFKYLQEKLKELENG